MAIEAINQYKRSDLIPVPLLPLLSLFPRACCTRSSVSPLLLATALACVQIGGD